MEIKNEEIITIKKYELHYKGFIAQIAIVRGDMRWDFCIIDTNKSGEIAHRQEHLHFMSEQEIIEAMRVSIDDCIKNPEEYY